MRYFLWVPVAAWSRFDTTKVENLEIPGPKTRKSAKINGLNSHMSLTYSDGTQQSVFNIPWICYIRLLERQQLLYSQGGKELSDGNKIIFLVTFHSVHWVDIRASAFTYEFCVSVRMVGMRFHFQNVLWIHGSGGYFWPAAGEKN